MISITAFCSAVFAISWSCRARRDGEEMIGCAHAAANQRMRQIRAISWRTRSVVLQRSREGAEM
jgi:hypothetical protein